MCINMDKEIKPHTSTLYGVRRLIQFLRSVTVKKPCCLCGKPTRSKNLLGEFIHTSCAHNYINQRVDKHRCKAEDRRQVDLYKQAIREVEQEKLNQEFDVLTGKSLGPSCSEASTCNSM